MRSKVTIVLLFLNVLLFFYIFYFERKWQEEKNFLEKRTGVYGPEVATIDSLARRTGGDPAVKLERRGESWWLTQPYEWPANRNAIDRILHELQLLKHETSFAVADLARSGQTLADYGLDRPAMELTFTSAGKSYTTLLGDQTRIGNRLYLLGPGGDRIHVVGRSLAESLGLPLAELRSDSIFTIPIFEVRSLNVQIAAPSNLKVRLRKDAAARWGFETPILARASKTAVEVTINTLNGLTAQKILEAREAAPEKTGLESPALRVTLEGNARRETLLLGNSAGPGEYYARIEDKAVVFTTVVPGPLLANLRLAQEALRDPRVLDFEPGTVTGLTVTMPGQPELTLQGPEANLAGPPWQAVVRVAGQAPQPLAADTAIVTDLLEKVYRLAARRFLSDAPSAGDLENYGFNRPERQITLNLNTGGGPRGTEPSTVTLQVGVSPDRPGVAFARATNAPYVYEILPDLLDETPVLARHYRQRVLRELPEAARITGLVLTDLATGEVVYSHQVAETEKNWGNILASEKEARRKALTFLLLQLRTLRAKEFTAEAFTPDQAETPQGPRPWKYRLDATLVFPGGAPATTSTLSLTDRLGGTTMVAGTPEFGGVVFTVMQDFLDSIFALTYGTTTDPGPPPAPATPPAEARPPAPAEEPVKSPDQPDRSGNP